jgi:hypothetical protein
MQTFYGHRRTAREKIGFMPKAPVKPAPRQRKTKTEVQQEFEQLAAEVESAREAEDPKRAESARVHETEVRQAVDGVSVENVVQRISGLGLEVNKALAGLSEKLTAEVTLLSTVREAIEIEQAEMARLHKIDIAATAVDQMVQDYRRQKEQLEGEVSGQRAAWEEETRTAERERREQEEALKKQRQREIDDYEYKKALERKKAQDKYDEEQRVQERSNLEKQQTLEKDWKLREAALKDQETELARLRKESEGFPALLKKETESAAARAAKDADVRFQQETLLLKKDAESDKRLAEVRIQTLEESLKHEAAQIDALEKQLAEAKAQVQEIAVRAIEGASGARALAHVNQIAIEQAKNRPQG